MKKRRILAMLACSVLAVGATCSLAACGGDKGITVWGAQNQQTMLREMIEEFKKENPDITTEIKLGVCGESEAYAQISKDVTASADVFGFANDQLINLRKINALARLSTAAVDKIKADNDEGSVQAAKILDGYYGYPYASDNGYFMYYDSSVVKETSVGSLEAVLQDCYDNGKYFIFNQREAWYVGTFFFGCGGTYELEWGGSKGTDLLSSKCNFDEKIPGKGDTTYGDVGGMAHIELNEKKLVFVNGDDTVISQYLNSDQLGACISGTWNAQLISQKWGENYAATKMPTFHSSLTDEDYQMNSFIGYKLYGVNPNSNHLEEAHKLAAFLSSKAMQEKRFDTLQTGPSNKEVAALDKVKNNIALAAFDAQRKAVNGVKFQDALPSSYWDAMKGFGEGVNGNKPSITKENLPEKLETLVKGLNTKASTEA